MPKPKKSALVAPSAALPATPSAPPVPFGAVPPPSFYRRALWAILGAAFALRLLLIATGGQHYFPDETRYLTSREAAQAFWSGDLEGSLRLLRTADHFLFKVIGTLPASLELLAGERPFIPAAFFALFSVAGLWLVWAILRRAGESERTALLGAALLALSATFFYYSRHLIPYDMAMAAGLLALYVGLRRSGRAAESLACGLLAAATFLIYNGYWVLAGFAMVAHTLQTLRPLGGCVSRALRAGAAFLGTIAALLGADYAAGGDLVRQLVAFSGSVTQGSFAEGGTLPFPYFWYAEHGMLLLWVAAFLYGGWSLLRGSRREALLLGLSGLLFVYLSLFVFSVFLEKFVVYGRLARQLVPFCCILAALLLERLWSSSRRGRFAAVAVLSLAALQAAINFRQAFVLVFPAEFQQAAAEVLTARPAGEGRYKVVNGLYLWPAPQPVPAAGWDVLRWPHPVEYLPLQYEGYSPEQRAQLRASAVAMRLRFTPTDAIFADGFESGGTGAWSLTPDAR